MKPGDEVLIPATRCKNPNYVKISAGHPVVHEIEGVVTFAVSGPTGNGKTAVHPHPGCDPSLLPKLVAAVRGAERMRDRLAMYEAQFEHDARPPAVIEVRYFLDALCDLAARMEADNAD